MNWSRLGLLALLVSGASAIGCSHEVAPQHFDVTLDDDGSRYQGSIDFPAYGSSDGCVEDSEKSRDPEPAGTCTPAALAIGTIQGISQIVSAEIDLDKTTDEPEYIIQVENHDSSEQFTCWMTSRDIGHAFECTTETWSPGALASITLTPI